MHDRVQRYIIPATVVLMTAAMTIWFGAKPTDGDSIWKDLLDLKNAGVIVSAAIAVGVTNYGLGYVCHAIFCAFMFFSRRERLVDIDRLIGAFGLTDRLAGGLTRRQLDAILSEFHLRLHSNASCTLREHCTRRNSAWYIAKTCVIAVVIGFLVAVSYILKSPHLVFHWPALVIWAFLLAIFGVTSWIVGTCWNVEFWEVAWTWLERDLATASLPEEWFRSNGFAAEDEDEAGEEAGAPDG